MSLLHVSNLAFRHPSQPEWLFRDVTFDINPRDRIGLIGPNGCGKTTLLRLLAGELEYPRSSISRQRGLAISYARQTTPDPEQRLWAYALASHTRLGSLHTKMQELEQHLEDSDVGMQYAALVSEYAEHGGYEFEARVSQVLAGLGLSDREMQLPLGVLSGGQRTRAELARVLLTPADVVLLDEPTNHLDLAARSWLEDYIASVDAAVVTVSHDRRFLEVAVSRILEIRRARLTSYSGNYAWYRGERDRAQQQEWDRYHAQQRRAMAAHRAAAARMQLARSTTTAPKGQRERFGKEFYAGKAGKLQRTAKVMIARTEREDRVTKPVAEDPIKALTFPSYSCPSDTVLELQHVSKSYGDKVLLRDLSMHVSYGDRIAITGPNGCGKSTLLKLVIGAVTADCGDITVGHNVRCGYFAQDADDIDQDSTALELCLSLHTDQSWVYTLFASVKLPMDQLHQPVAQMSAGERARVALVRMLLTSPNFLILDEPTNHLDIDAQEAMESTLAQFPGPMIFVSHDRQFIDRLATRVIAADNAFRTNMSSS